MIQIIFLILVGAISRLIPHPWNFTAIGAVSLLSGQFLLKAQNNTSRFGRVKQILVPLSIPLLALLISDLFLGFYSGMIYVYSATLVMVAMGFLTSSIFQMKSPEKKESLRSVKDSPSATVEDSPSANKISLPAMKEILLGLSCLGGSLLFFLLTNFAVWKTSGMYSLNFEGLLQCYVMALPFLKWQIAGDFVYYAGLIFVLQKTSQASLNLNSNLNSSASL